MASNKASVPADHGGGLDDQHDGVEPAPVEGTRQHYKQDPICGGESWSLDLSLKDQDLMSESQDLRVTLVTGHQQQPKPGDQQPEQVRHER
jgi:hypothetical protein